MVRPFGRFFYIETRVFFKIDFFLSKEYGNGKPRGAVFFRLFFWGGWFTPVSTNTIMQFIQYLRDTKGELKHVVWPTRHQAIAFTVLVVVLSVVTSVYLGAFDAFFTSLIKKLVVR